MKDILFHTQFTAERLKIVAQKMANSIASIKRSGFKVVRTVFLDLTYTKGRLILFLVKFIYISLILK